MRKIFKFVATSYLLFAISYLPVSAANYFFNPHFILTNEELTDYHSLSLSEIQYFLENKNSVLAKLILPDYQGVNKKAAEIIWQAAQESQINPRVLLATLQKEQSLITDLDPSQNQLDKAMGYRCPDDGVCSPKTLSFGKQVDGAAWQFRQYLNQPNLWTYQAGQQYEIDGYQITPVNQATAGFYNYTPHYSGNKRFYQLYQEYFGRNYPDGSLLKANDSPAVWLIESGTRRLITSWGILISRFDPKKILVVPRLDLEKYETAPEIKFHNYSLLKTPEGKIYLLVDTTLRYITSPEVFQRLGFNSDEVLEASIADLSGYTYGQEITSDSLYPTGALLQNKLSGGVYYVESGVKQPIYSREIMAVNFKNKILTQVSAEELGKYPDGEPVKFKDGELIKADNNNKVYVISDGNRRWIKTETAFVKFGYKWDNIVMTSKQAVDVHLLGEDLE
ncbi:MAG: hypothetical protein A2729_02165 [Candidatus Buchananbacteria bacterium RIFCSPHIGHO2_01_FULL_39_14]|uniref:Uncharacterized protein n=1 Tax=Candidatus Buchananbacteria bacterium RIFCSPHIGHO2_01_FULL_39_14 TaxID=1797532 RepID=A0A1G1XXX6_9BACT|nr:MAG: hypothetical protein A2729_02165 [Candidatus Buchananbacteria bacterium RIFCSPHIGHO2_01_FULL_39_14]OGY48214.1 MAG: hypothetical protein A3D39_03770 [Candidatus Buchananbacteria bacterium RIFCSPHIGHO2_02_FULL_39_17]